MYNLPLLLVVLLNRVMGITPHQLLGRLQTKAASMGDPNPWLVQVRFVGGSTPICILQRWRRVAPLICHLQRWTQVARVF
jgi:hypothetical protein